MSGVLLPWRFAGSAASAAHNGLAASFHRRMHATYPRQCSQPLVSATAGELSNEMG